MKNSALRTVTNNLNKYADDKQKNLYKKFPSTHFLAKPKNIHNVLLWNTFFRRNLHRLASDYLGIKLHLYQAIMLYLMGVSNFICVIASRASAKSFIIALYACCRCITRPNTLMVLTSATKGQSKLIVAQKIKKELMEKSSALRQEIERVQDGQNEIVVHFRNNSTITVVPASENARGYRSTCAIREEFRQISKNIDDSIISPFQVIRQPAFMMSNTYSSLKELQEDPVDIYISSSWYDSHWMWGIVEQAKNDMLSDNFGCLMAFDESVVLKHNIKTPKQMERERKKQDPLTWRIEYLNERIKQNASAFFSYEILIQNQILRQPFYPRTLENYKSNKKNPYMIPKQIGEIRIISCDMAFVDNNNNDNSVFSCIRALPEVVTHYDEEDNAKAVVKQGYRRIVPYLEAHKGGDTTRQAIRIRQLYEDFEADYIVLDLRSGGIAVYYLLAKTLYDNERGCEYAPLTCMNNDKLSKSINITGAKPVIYTISATQQLNSDIAFDFRNCLIDKNINFLLNYSEAKDEILSEYKEYKETHDGEVQLFFEIPFIETQLFVKETSDLLYEKMEQTGVVRIYEQSMNKKDRYTSVSYGNYFITQLEKDLLSISKQDINPKSIMSLGRKAVLPYGRKRC